MINAKTWMPWQKGLVARSLSAVIVVVLLLGGISSLVVSNAFNQRESQQALKALNELVDAELTPLALPVSHTMNNWLQKLCRG